MNIRMRKSDEPDLDYETEINLQGLNYEPSFEEVCQLAWKCAVEDGVISGAQDYTEYSFTSFDGDRLKIQT